MLAQSCFSKTEKASVTRPLLPITLSLFNYASSTHSTPTIEINSSVISSLTRSGMWERHYTQSPMTSVPTWIPVLM